MRFAMMQPTATAEDFRNDAGAILYLRAWAQTPPDSNLHETPGIMPANDDEHELVWIFPECKQYDIYIDLSRGWLFDADVALPTPFKRGDILTRRKGWDKEDDGEVFVLDSFELLDEASRTWHDNDAVGGIYSGNSHNIRVRGYSLADSGHVYDYTSSYDHEQLEYYREKLTENECLLHYISRYLRGELGLGELMALQCRYALQHMIDDNEWIYRSADVPNIPEYPRETLRERSPSFGIFWVISDDSDYADYKLIRFSVPCSGDGTPLKAPSVPLNAKDGTSYGFRETWESQITHNAKHAAYNDKSHVHYPRGRVKVSGNNAVIFLSPEIFLKRIVNDIKIEFGLGNSRARNIKVISDKSLRCPDFPR